MTWVLGMSTMFGYSLGMADVQATIDFTDGSKKYYDCVQKIHHVGNFVAAGFSGDIHNGFDLVENLKDFLSGVENGRCWIPDFVSREWGKQAREWYSNLPDSRKRPVQIMLMSVYPDLDTLPGMAKSYVAILKSPDFKVTKMSRDVKVIGIGSGNDVKEYVRIVNKLNDDWFPLAQSEVHNPGGFAQAVMVVIHSEMIRKIVPGVSSCIQTCVVKRGGVGIAYPEVRVDIGMSTEHIVKSPVLTTSWKEFKRKMKTEGIELSSASAISA